jgi:tetratricopeptide (TPR) repeat protein
MKPLWTVLLLLACASGARAESLESIFNAGNEAFFRGDFDAAIGRYEALRSAGVHDPDVELNLATAHARKGQLGRAVLGFERALWLRPGDDAAEDGLLAARNLLAKGRADREGEAELRTRPPLAEALVRPFSADALALCALFLSTLSVACFAALGATRRSGVKLALAIAAPLAALGLLMVGGGLLVKLEVLREGEAAIVLEEGAPLREGPDDRAQVRKKALEGQAARILRREGRHVETVLETGARGWMDSKDLGRLRPD